MQLQRHTGQRLQDAVMQFTREAEPFVFHRRAFKSLLREKRIEISSDLARNALQHAIFLK